MLLGLTLAVGTAEAGKGGTKGKSSTTTDTSGTTDDSLGSIDPTNVPLLGSDSLTASATSDPVLTDSFDPMSTVRSMNAVALEQINAPAAHQYATGSGVVVAVLDSGFDLEHPAIAANLMGHGYDAIDGDMDPHDTGDGFDNNYDGVVDGGVGHGTFVSAMVLLSAPDATILPVRVRDDEGFGTDQELADGVMFALTMGADVINLSITSAPDWSPELFEAMKLAQDMGVPTITSAGNDGLNYIPDSTFVWECSLNVGSVDSMDFIAEFSNSQDHRRAQHVLAPGVDLFGPFANGEYATWSGTSFSTPIISGAIALAKQLDPALGHEDVRNLVKDAFVPVVDRIGRTTRYNGRIDLLQVVTR
jgi:subtilisin family serine protease